MVFKTKTTTVMKTCYVKFLNQSSGTISDKEYYFNLDGFMPEINDIVKVDNYDSPIVVTRYLESNYEYYNFTNGDLCESTDFNKTPITVLKISEENIIGKYDT